MRNAISLESVSPVAEERDLAMELLTDALTNSSHCFSQSNSHAEIDQAHKVAE
jgi:hypothetical protein